MSYLANHHLVLSIIQNTCESVTRERLRHVRASCQFGNVFFFNDYWSEPIGYVIWANVNADSLFRLKEYGEGPVMEYEWNEGQYVLVLDLCFLPQGLRICLPQIKELMKKTELIAFNRKGVFRAYKFGKLLSNSAIESLFN